MTPKPTLSELRAMSVQERLAHFVAWLGEQPRETEYSYTWADTCALSQYTSDLFAGKPFVEPSEARWFVGGYGAALYALQIYHTLGELHDKLAAIIGTQSAPLPEPAPLTDAQMEVLESRPLVPVFPVRKEGK